MEELLPDSRAVSSISLSAGTALLVPFVGFERAPG